METLQTLIPKGIYIAKIASTCMRDMREKEYYFILKRGLPGQEGRDIRHIVYSKDAENIFERCISKNGYCLLTINHHLEREGKQL